MAALSCAEGESPRSRDLALGGELLCTGSRSFHLAACLLPRATREAATSLYAFCRTADDLIDLHDSPLALVQLRSQLDRVYAGGALVEPVERMLANIVGRFQVPRTLLDALLEGFEWDTQGRRYASLAELHSYAARVAGSVGAMMSLLMGVRDASVVARACDLGVAMQLTNIARDVGEDAAHGRVYLPLDWLREAGIDVAEWLARPTFTPALAEVIERLLREADLLYRRALPGIGYLPWRARAGVHAARMLYAEIGQDLRRHRRDAVARRAHVGGIRKGVLVCAALVATLRPRAADLAPPIDANVFLIRAIDTQWRSGKFAESPTPGRIVRRPDQGRAEWLLELFERLERRDAGMVES